MRRVWLMLWRVGRADVKLWWRAIRSPTRPRWLIPASLGLGLFALFPFSWAIPIVGALDDFVIAPALFHALVSMLPKSGAEERAPGRRP